MGFNDFSYVRPNYDEVKAKLIFLIDKLSTDDLIEKVKETINQINVVRNNVVTMGTLASIRNSINTEDEFYDKEREYWDEYEPLYNEVYTLFYKALV